MTVRIWDLRTLSRPTPQELDLGTVPPLVALEAEADHLKDMVLGEVDGRPTVAAVTEGSEGLVRIWDLRTGTERAMPSGLMANGLALGEVDGVPVAVWGSDRRLLVWDLREGTEPLELGRRGRGCVGAGGRAGRGPAARRPPAATRPSESGTCAAAPSRRGWRVIAAMSTSWSSASWMVARSR